MGNLDWPRDAVEVRTSAEDGRAVSTEWTAEVVEAVAMPFSSGGLSHPALYLSFPMDWMIPKGALNGPPDLI